VSIRGFKSSVELNGAGHTASILASGIGVILVSSVLFGVMAVCVRIAASEMSFAQIAFVRFAGALLVLLAFGRGSLRPQPRNLPRVLLRGLLGGAAILLYFRGIQGAGAGFATLIHCTYPVYTALIAGMLLGERLDARVGVALLLNLGGAAIMLGPAARLDDTTFSGGLSALAAALLAGGAVAAARHLRATEGAYLITFYFMAVGAALSAPALLLPLPAFTWTLALALGGTVLASVAGQVLLHYGLGFASATQGSLACATTVVSTAVFEAIFLGDVLSSHALIGAALFIAAVTLVAGRR
jgi:drug/metabolite transporter (DMT)-like permease